MAFDSFFETGNHHSLADHEFQGFAPFAAGGIEFLSVGESANVVNLHSIAVFYGHNTLHE